jgi:glycosyltransferase involved in cell wall biosynthesis
VSRPPSAAFVYPNPRLQLAREVAAGVAPDTGLLGQNHLGRYGVDARICESRVRRRARDGGVLHRLTWNLRELTLPWELGDADVVLTPLANLLPVAARLRRRPRVVLFDWGIAGQLARVSSRRRWLLRRALDVTAAILSPSSSMRDRLLERADLDPDRVCVVELGADADWLVPDGTSRGREVLAVGKDMARDYHTLAEALRLGGGPAVLVAKPRNLVGVDLPQEATVRVGVSWRELRSLYAHAGCVVVALRREDAGVGSDGSGLTALLEAMAMGAPVVATGRNVIADYVDDGRTGLLVPPEDPPALAAAIRRVREDPELAASLGRAARSAIEERFTSRLLAERLAPVVHAHAA